MSQRTRIKKKKKELTPRQVDMAFRAARQETGFPWVLPSMMAAVTGKVGQQKSKGGKR